MQTTQSTAKLKRRALPKRPRLGNTWQDFGWRKKLVGPLPREPLSKLPSDQLKHARSARNRALSASC